MIGTIQEYRNRTVDFLAFNYVSSAVPVTQTFTLPGEAGSLITGVAKLAQRFLLELLTERGSMPYDPNRGTTFMTEIRSGRIRTNLNLFTAFSVAELQIRNTLRLEEDLDRDPADERYGTANLTSANISGDFASVNISLVSAAGENVNVFYPIKVVAV